MREDRQSFPRRITCRDPEKETRSGPDVRQERKVCDDQSFCRGVVEDGRLRQTEVETARPNPRNFDSRILYK